jgi:THO complex subunit 3
MDGRKLASGSTDKSARVFTVDEHRHGKDVELKGHTDSVDQLTWDPTHADSLATASGDKTVRLWDVRSGKTSQQFNMPGENINITWSPDGKSIAVGNRDDQLSFIDLRTNKVVGEKKFTYEVNEIRYDTSGDYLFVTTGQGTIEVLRCPTMEFHRKHMAHTSNCYCIDFDPLGRFFAVGAADALVSLWDASEMICLRTFGNLEWAVRTISINFDGSLIAAASEDTYIDICNTETGEQVEKIPVQYAINQIAWHPAKSLLAFAGDEKDDRKDDVGSVKIWGYRHEGRSYEDRLR